MKLDLPDTEGIQSLTKELKDLFQIEASGFRVHPSSSFGINEIARGLGRLFPHRRSIAYIKGCGPAFDSLAMYFSMEGYAVQGLDYGSIENLDWIESLKKDTLFVLMSEDDPATGQTYVLDIIRERLSEKKIFLVSCSSLRHILDTKWQTAPYWARIFSFAPSFAISVLGEKSANVEPLVHGPSDWNPRKGWQKFLYIKENKKLVKEFEAKKWGGAKAFFESGDHRLFDRAAVYWDDMDGEALVQDLSERLGFKTEPVGSELRLETTSPCRWGKSKSIQWLLEQGHNEEKIRGLVLISLDLLEKNVGPELEASRKKILALQSGN